MTVGDFLEFIFRLNPVLFALIIVAFGFGSLLLVALKTKSFEESILNSPGVMVGDLFLLPITGFLISTFYKSVQNPLPIFQSAWWNLLLVVATLLAIISAIRFKHFNIWWLPHNIFYSLMAYILITFLAKGLIQLIIGKEGPKLWLVWGLVIILAALHQALGIVFPKKFPKIV